ncbi:MAG: hypothetical protein RL033_5140 [Pseudomonadota bacterium]
MGLQSKKGVLAFSLAGIALLAACSGDPLLGHPELTDEGEDGALEEEGVVLGTTWEALSYPTCMYPWSDPDGDGWGWEFNRSCVMYKPPAPPAPPAPPPAGGSAGASSTPAPAPAPIPPANCKNPEGTHSVMAALAVAAANELGRWQPVQDFAIGRVGNNEALVLSAAGKAKCGACTNIQALLDLQKDEAAGKVVLPGNVMVVPVALRSRMVAKYRDQQGCERQPSNGGTTNCPAEQHQLIFQRSEKGGCDTNYFFVAKKTDGTALQYPKQLKNKLLFVDRENPYVQFQSVGEVVSIDPTYGLNDAGSTSTGACTSSCVKIGGADVTSQCCACAGQTKSFRRSTWNPATYLCL